MVKLAKLEINYIFPVPVGEEFELFAWAHKIDGKKVSGQLAIKGTIDLTTLIADDTIEVIDWKTGRRMDWTTGQVKDYKKLENNKSGAACIPMGENGYEALGISFQLADITNAKKIAQQNSMSQLI